MPNPRKNGGETTAAAWRKFLEAVPPNDVIIERLVLGAILTRKGFMDEIHDSVSPDDFYDSRLQTLFNACLELHSKGEPVNFATVRIHIEEKGLGREAGKSDELTKIISALGNLSVSVENPDHLVGKLVRLSMRRKLIARCASIMLESYKPDADVENILAASESALAELDRGVAKTTFSSAQELGEEFYAKTTETAKNGGKLAGISTGFDNLDNLTYGLRPSDLVIVAARPSMGKTAFALCMAMNAALQQNVGVGIFSLEMSKQQLTQRMHSVFSKINLKKIIRSEQLDKNDWASIDLAKSVIEKAPIYIDDTPSITAQEMRSRARRLKREKNIGLIVVDYLQLMRTERKTLSRELEISDISRSLKALAKELNIPVIALAQLNRKVEDRFNKRPVLSDLRESGAIEQDADTIMFVYRDDVYKYIRPEDRPVRGVAEIIIGKQRNGPVGTAELLYVSSCTSFENMLVKWDQQKTPPKMTGTQPCPALGVSTSVPEQASERQTPYQQPLIGQTEQPDSFSSYEGEDYVDIA